LYQASIVGDTNLDGTCNGDDLGIIIGLGTYDDNISTHTWMEGNSTGDGYVNANDFGAIIGLGTYGQTVTASTIDNTVDNSEYGFLPAGIHLTQGRHDFQYDYLY